MFCLKFCKEWIIDFHFIFVAIERSTLLKNDLIVEGELDGKNKTQTSTLLFAVRKCHLSMLCMYYLPILPCIRLKY